jgi:hypothetical protein
MSICNKQPKSIIRFAGLKFIEAITEANIIKKNRLHRYNQMVWTNQPLSINYCWLTFKKFKQKSRIKIFKCASAQQ